MIINKAIFKDEIFISKFHSNYNKCAKMLGITTPQLHRFLNSDSQAGAKFLGGLYIYCEKNNLKFSEYIVFENI